MNNDTLDTASDSPDRTLCSDRSCPMHLPTEDHARRVCAARAAEDTLDTAEAEPTGDPTMTAPAMIRMIRKLDLYAIKGCQSEGRVAAYVDAEHKLDIAHAQRLGVDVAQLLVSQPDNHAQALAIIETLVRSGAVGLVVVAGVALSPAIDSLARSVDVVLLWGE